MPSSITRTSIGIDVDLIEPAKEKSRQFDRFGKPNLSAYINALIRKDLGLSKAGSGGKSEAGDFVKKTRKAA